MSKFYAIKKGRKIGIFNSWDECKEYTQGYSGAIYKSFNNYEDAKNFLEDKKEKIIESEKNIKNYAYVDGSFDNILNVYGSGVVIVSNGRKFVHKMAGNDEELAKLRNVAGEIEGVKYVLNFAKKNNLEDITIYYDYTGIEEWATGNWKRNLSYTENYFRFVNSIKRDVKINFVKVKAHSGIELNEIVDKLAKEAILEFTEKSNTTNKHIIEEKEFYFGSDEDLDELRKLKK